MLAPGKANGDIWNENMLAVKKPMQIMLKISASCGPIVRTKPDFFLMKISGASAMTEYRMV